MTRRPTKGDFLAGIHTEKQTPEQRALMRKEYERVTAKLAADYASGEIRSVSDRERRQERQGAWRLSH